MKSLGRGIVRGGAMEADDGSRDMNWWRCSPASVNRYWAKAWKGTKQEYKKMK
jgi:hypothetical protein